MKTKILITKILITNDDGIDADGIVRLTKLAVKYGEVWVVAPDGQRSASSHSLTLNNHMDIYPYDMGIEGVKAFTCSGTPADCIRVGSLGVMPYKPDIVLSGINKGYNAATDIQYSGTCGAAFEGSFQGFHSIAVSEGFNGNHEVTDRYLEEIMDKVIESPLKFGQIWNINFPDCPLDDCNGILWDRKVSIGMYFKDHYEEIEKLPDGGSRYSIVGRHIDSYEEGTDLKAISDNYVSVGIVNNVGL